MKSTTIARNYADALFLAAEAEGGTAVVERYGRLLEAVAGATQADERIAIALESPRVSKGVKAELLVHALGHLAPAQQYDVLQDQKLNRVHAGVTLAHEADTGLEKQIVERLATALGKEVRAHFRADRAILGGVVVRVGDRIYDGSLRRKLAVLRRKMLVGD